MLARVYFICWVDADFDRKRIKKNMDTRGNLNVVTFS